MANNRTVPYFPDEEAAGNRLGRKAKESPFMVIGE